MAARNDQTLQIALIVFVGLTVVLGGFLVYVSRLNSEKFQQLEQTRQQSSQEQGRARQLQTENEQYRTFMGFGQFDEFDDVKTQYDEDMETFASTFPEDVRVYRNLVAQLDSENKRSTDQEAQAKQREKELKERLTAIEAEKDAQIKQYSETVKQIQADAASQRTTFEQARADLNAKQRELVETLERQRATHAEQVAQLEQQIATLTGQFESVVRSRERLLEDRQQESPSFEVADGRVAWVNQANQTVWIDLGRLDSLRPQVTFSVYEQAANDAGKAEKKASIEVIRLLSEHMAEARITSDDPRNPILPGDHIYSQVWHRGKAIHFALTGVLDLDGDGRSDVQQAKDLIKLNGGVIDASVNEAGVAEGEITVETRYLVLGDYPGLPSQSELRTSWDAMSEKAELEGVETITLPEFLNQMGYKPLDRTVVLGAGARASDFTPKPGQFRPRSPYSVR